MEILQSVQILQDSNQNVRADIIELTPQMAKDEVDNKWWNDPNLSDSFLKERDLHWTWEGIARDYGHDALHSCVAVLSQAGYLEGAMAYQFNAKSKLEPSAGSIYIGWLATAPKNRPRLVNQPPHRGIGSVLMYWAVRESYMAGLGGRIILQSLPTPETLSFYENKGLVRTDLTQPKTGLIDYELPKLAAVTWLSKQGDLQ